jgi:hypothetical protein
VNTKDKHEILKLLAEGAVRRLEVLPSPIVRVSGPITSGGFGYDKNLKRFLKAQEVLREKGRIVFDYFEGHDDEDVIKSLELLWEEVIKYYRDQSLPLALSKKSI